MYVCMYQDATWCGGRPRPLPHCVRWGPSSPQTGHNPQFSTHVCCGQMAGSIKLLLGREVGLGPAHIVLDGDQAPQKRGIAVPHFLAHVCCGQTAGWIKMLLGTEVGLGPGNIVLDGGPTSPQNKGAQQPPLFGLCLLWPNGCPSQQLLSSCQDSIFILKIQDNILPCIFRVLFKSIYVQDIFETILTKVKILLKILLL